MGDLVSKIWDFFLSEKVSLTPKITIPLLFCLAIFLFVDYYGFFYYYANSKKVEYLSKIEDVKIKCHSDTIIISHLDDMMNEALDRKNVFQWFGSLFENKNIEITPSNSNNFNAIEDFLPLYERNRLWQTITSSLFGIVVMAFSLFGLIYVIIYGSYDRPAAIVRCIMLIFASTVIIWLSQWIFGFMPVIAGRAYINYIIQCVINIIIIVIVYRKLNKNEGGYYKL